MNTNYSYIIADHIRSACFIIADGVLPSPKQRGYVLRRLIRRALIASVKLGINLEQKEYFADLVDSVVSIYSGVYDAIADNRELIVNTLYTEAQKFLKARINGEREWAKYLNSDKPRDDETLTTFAWDLYQSHGVPFEVSEEQVEKAGLNLNTESLHKLVEDHQQKSATVSAGQFKSGLGTDSAKARQLHTTTHLLHAVLRNLYGAQVGQIGSAITDEKARFDVTLSEEVTKEMETQIIDSVQGFLATHAVVTHAEMTEPEARALGAIGLFGEKYPEIVTVYSIITPDGTVLSREFCGGPHVENTKDIPDFHLLKVKSIGQGRKRFEFTV